MRPSHNPDNGLTCRSGGSHFVVSLHVHNLLELERQLLVSRLGPSAQSSAEDVMKCDVRNGLE